jgi:hypothetical protein
MIEELSLFSTKISVISPGCLSDPFEALRFQASAGRGCWAVVSLSDSEVCVERFDHMTCLWISKAASVLRLPKYTPFMGLATSTLPNAPVRQYKPPTTLGARYGLSNPHRRLSCNNPAADQRQL